ncbi:M16 family metallopeptidase [Roseateles sp.]|uniref:M16 family metallopeptidase n=1 Tax=Roseateles sp. TaxID=1971397 RepID=UPI00391B4AF9
MHAPPASSAPQPAPLLSTLANGLRLVAIPMPWRATVSLSVFVRTGSLHEQLPRLNGISHVVEHMAFKGTATRDCQRINLDAEALGADVNAHTDKDHTAFHIEGLPEDLPAFVDLLADIVLNPSFPEEELARELRVIEQEYNEYEEDPSALAFRLFDQACYGSRHPAGRPIIGTRANIRRFKRRDLLDYVGRQYSACNVVIGVAGPLDERRFEALRRQIEAQTGFGAMPAGTPNLIEQPAWQGGLKARRLAGSGQTQLVLGFAAPALPEGEARTLPHVLAAALLGEGMSSPLLDEIRERRGLAYNAGCAADIWPHGGQFVIDAATSPEQAVELLEAVHALLRRHADGADQEVALERARRQLRVRALRGLEQPSRRLEAAAQDLFTFSRLRDTQDWLRHLDAVTPAQVRAVFEAMQEQNRARPALALAGSVPAKARERAAALFGLGEQA